MLGGELQVVASFSLILGAILGAILCSYMRAGRNRLLPTEGALETYLDLREKLESLQQTLQADAPGASPMVDMDKELPAKSAKAPSRECTKPSLAALAAAVEYDPPVTSKDLPNVAAWRRLDKPRNLAHHVSRHVQPAAENIVAPVRRKNRPVGHQAAIDSRTAEEIVMRHFGVCMDPLPLPMGGSAGLANNVLRMPAARAEAPGHQGWRSLAL